MTPNPAAEAFRDDIQSALEALRRGGVILYPTDTVWGLGCDATNPRAVEAVYALKQRSESKSMLVLVESAERLDYYCDEVPEVALQLSELSEKPVTLVLDGARNLASNLIAPDGSIGIRVSRDPFSQALCRALRRPLVSTSANISGQHSPAFFHEIAPEIVSAVDYAVRWRRDDTTPRTPSSVIKITADGQFKILRR